jgi:ATP-dependent DNA ligase
LNIGFRWIKPQLTRLADEAPRGSDWLHEIKYDGYRIHARIDSDKIQLLTRTGLDWSIDISAPSKSSVR